MSHTGRSSVRLADSSNGKTISRRGLSIGGFGAVLIRPFSQVVIAVRDIAGPMLHEIPSI
jgi:hypothetical protein